MGLHIGEQEIELAALMIMRDDSPRNPLQPFNPVGIGIGV